MRTILISRFFGAVCDYPLLRIILILLSLLGLAMFAMPLAVRILNVGNGFGLAVSLILLLCVIFRTPLKQFADRCTESRIGRIGCGTAAVIVILGLLYCAAVSIAMLYHANKKPPSQPKAMIVLGCKVRGTVPSLMLSRRIQAAYQAMQQYPELTVIASGGQGSDEEISEAQCIYDTLISLGADADRIVMENRSTTTSENMRFSREILSSLGISPDSVILVASDGYHELRAQMLAGYEGITNCYPVSAPTSWYLMPTYTVREWFGVAHAFVFHA